MSSAPPAPSALPVAARLAWWGTSWLRGHLGPDELLDGVLDDDVTHVVVADAERSADGLLTALAAARSAGATGFGAAFPVEGDPAGLGGPPVLNAAALEAGEAVVVLGVGDPGLAMVPTRVGPSVEWSRYAALRRQLPDVGDADRELRAVLAGSADRLASLDVARWRPEVADRLMDLRHRRGVAAPPGVPARCVDLAERGLQAVEIADLALSDDGGAITAYEADERRRALAPLARAGRHALLAACSPEVWPPD